MVKERQHATDAMFEPLGEIIDMLRNYGVAIPEESLVQLNELPEKWANTKRLSVIAIQQVDLVFLLKLKIQFPRLVAQELIGKVSIWKTDWVPATAHKRKRNLDPH